VNHRVGKGCAFWVAHSGTHKAQVSPGDAAAADPRPLDARTTRSGKPNAPR
jgi:hypothetical protein